MGTEAPDLSVVVVNRNTRRLLTELLDSLDAGGGDLGIEVIVVDNGSADGSAEAAAARERPPVLILNDGNAGYARANNQGLEVARGRYLMLLNSDTVVPPGALARLVRWMDAHPAAGVCGPALRSPDGSLQRTCRSLESPWRWFCDLSGLGGIFPRSPLLGNLHRRFDHRATRPVDWLIGAAMVARREAVEAVGVLDERFWLYCNDSDWCRRFWDAGWEVWFVHDVEILHHGGATIAIESVDGALQEAMMRNHLDFQRKYWGGAAAGWVRLWMVLGFGARAARMAARRGGEAAAMRRDFQHRALLALRGAGPAR